MRRWHLRKQHHLKQPPSAWNSWPSSRANTISLTDLMSRRSVGQQCWPHWSTREFFEIRSQRGMLEAINCIMHARPVCLRTKGMDATCTAYVTEKCHRNTAFLLSSFFYFLIIVKHLNTLLQYWGTQRTVTVIFRHSSPKRKEHSDAAMQV